MRTSVLVLVLGLVVAFAGCGGDDDDGSEAAATTSASTAPAASGDDRLDAASWDTYVATRDHARKVNDAAITTFQACRKLVFSGAPTEKVQKCFGAPTVAVVSESQKVLSTLNDIAGEASGACADALDTTIGNVKLYASTVQQIGLSVQQASLPTTNEIDESLNMLGAAKASNRKVEATCEPA